MMSKSLAIALNEKDVENSYRHEFKKKFKDMEITSPFGCDGFGVSKSHKVRTLMEFKDDLNLSNKSELVKVLAQSVFYVKRFYDKGIVPPSTIFIGDRNECLTLHVNDIIKYLEMDLDWTVPPSSAHSISDLVLTMMKDESIKPFVYDSHHFPECIQKVKDLTDNVQRKVLVTDKNITEVFRYFDEKVLVKNKFTTNERANLFVQILVNKVDNYLHPIKKRKTVVSKALGEVPVVSRDAFESFFNHFSSSYTPSQKHKLAGVVDRIVEDSTRRKQGEFFTPAIWVDKAHEYIASVFGEDWKEKYVVWDPAWGTGNLTRDYKFKELYCSTLIQADIDTANQMGYNPEATKFRFDFLNDDYSQLPNGLRSAIENGREIIVLMNPPYVTGASSMVKSKKGASDTKVRLEMKNSQISFGKSSANLYSQFIYNSLTKGTVNLALFSPPLYLSGAAFKGMRFFLNNKVHFTKGFMMDAANFADVKSWGLSFTILKNGTSENNVHNTVHLDLLDLDDNFVIIEKGKKLIYNTDSLLAGNTYAKSLNKTKSKIDFPHISSPLKIVNSGGIKVTEDFLGYINANGNSVRTNSTLVGLYSAIFAGGSKGSGHSPGFSINHENLFQTLTYFSVRKLIKGNWINWYDEYLAPNKNHEFFEQFQFDCLVYSLFESKSNQSSLRQITYKDQLWDIKNEFFWMSADKMKELADQNGYDEIYNDARTSSDRYVHKLLFGEERIYDKLSPDAKAVLDKATELVERSMELRQVMANDENHLNSWDAGYAQLKLVWKEYFQEEFKEFRQLYKNLEDRMRPLVYELGFLKK